MSDPDVGRRRVDWLELFFDLVFVVILKQLTGLLHGQPGLGQFLEVVGLFAVVWIAWLNVTAFISRSAASPADPRFAVLLSMAGFGLIAVSIPTAVTGGAPLFVVGLLIARTALWPLWLKASRGIPRGWIRVTAYGPGLAALWLGSLVVPSGARPWVWLALVAIDVAASAVGFTNASIEVSHMFERIGLFVMIVLGESLVEVILAVRSDQSALAWAISAGAFAFICILWWQYYQLGAPLTERVLGRTSAPVLRDVVVLAHFLIVLGLVGIAGGLGSAIDHADARSLPYGAAIALGAGLATYQLASVLISWRVGVKAVDVVLVAIPGAVVAALFAVFGAVWPAWLDVAILLAAVTMNQIALPGIRRRFFAYSAAIRASE